MANRIEPPILLSRLMVFVFATSVVVLGTLLITLYNMFPLNRPQIFFLETTAAKDRIVKLTDLNDVQGKYKQFLSAFVMEYVKARNEVVPNIGNMRQRWNNDNRGLIYAWSTNDVYNEFKNTKMWQALMQDIPDFEFSCPVEFVETPKNPQANVWAVTFWYFCKDNNGQTDKKKYTVRVKLDIDNQQNIKWVERLTNPLGVRVSGYGIESGDGDPLDTGFTGI